MKKLSLKQLYSCLTIAIASLALVACGGGTSDTKDVIKIALAGPTTGPVAQYGDMQMIGAQMAIEQINAAGGINGTMLKGVVYDDACDPKQAVSVANKVVNNGIKFVIGHLCSSSTQPASDIYEDEGVLMISAASTSPAITDRGYQMIFRTIGRDDVQGPNAGKYIVNAIKPKNLAIIHDKQQYGEGLASAVKATAEENGLSVKMYEGITAGEKDFSSLAAKMKESEIDFVYYGGYHPELGLILRQSSEKGFNPGFMGPEGVGNKDLSAIAGNAAEGLLVTLPPSFDQDPANKTLVDAFKAKQQDPSGPFVLTAYAAVKVIADSMIKGKTTDPSEIQSILRKNEFDTPIGKVKFDEKGDLNDFQFVVYTWHADGSKTKIK